MLHFGVNVQKVKYALKINREEYAIINDKSSIGSFFHFTFDYENYKNYNSSFIIDYLQLVIKTLSSADNLDALLQYRLKQAKKIYNDVAKNLNSENSTEKKQMTIDDLKLNYNLEKSILGEYYSDAWCQEHHAKCLKNFDLNMHYFKTLNKKEFNESIEKFLNVEKQFIEIKDLNTLKNKSGFYMMILDEYKSAYIGQSFDLYRRIREHWSHRKPFDRLIFPQNNVDNSIMSIDCFRALDTTRIFVRTCSEKTFEKLLDNDYEDKLISNFNQKFLLNRIDGGLNPLIFNYKKRNND